MQRCSTGEVLGLCSAVGAVDLGSEGQFAVAHKDATVSFWNNDKLNSCVTFPNCTASQITLRCDCSHDNAVVYVLLNVSLIVSISVAAKTPIATAKVPIKAVQGLKAVGDYLCAWQPDNRLYVYSEYSLTLLKQLQFDSVVSSVAKTTLGEFVVVLSDGSLVVIDKFLEQSITLKLPIKNQSCLDSIVVDAKEHSNGQWLYCQHNSWTLCEQIEADSCSGKELQLQAEVSVSTTSKIIELINISAKFSLLRCNDDSVLCLQDSSMTVLPPDWSPGKLVALFGQRALTSDLKLYEQSQASWNRLPDLIALTTQRHVNSLSNASVSACGRKLALEHETKEFEHEITALLVQDQRVYVGLYDGSLIILENNVELAHLLLTAGPLNRLQMFNKTLVAVTFDAVALVEEKNKKFTQVLVPIGSSISRISLVDQVLTVETSYDSKQLAWDLEFLARICQVEPPKMPELESTEFSRSSFDYSKQEQSQAETHSGGLNGFMSNFPVPFASLHSDFGFVNETNSARLDETVTALQFSSNDYRDLAHDVSASWSRDHLDSLLSRVSLPSIAETTNSSRILAAMAKHGDVLVYKVLGKHVQKLLKSKEPLQVSRAVDLLGVAPAVADIPFDELKLVEDSSDLFYRYSKRLCQVDKLWFVQKLLNEVDQKHSRAEVACRLVSAAFEQNLLLPFGESWLPAIKVLIRGMHQQDQATKYAVQTLTMLSKSEPTSCAFDENVAISLGPTSQDFGYLFDLTQNAEYILAKPQDTPTSPLSFVDGRLEVQCGDKRAHWTIPSSVQKFFKTTNVIKSELS